MSLELQVVDPDDVTLPAWLCDSSLSLEDLGTLLVLASITHTSNGAAFERWVQSPNFQLSMRRLVDLKVIPVSVGSGVINISVDCDQVPMLNTEAQG